MESKGSASENENHFYILPQEAASRHITLWGQRALRTMSSTDNLSTNGLLVVALSVRPLAHHLIETKEDRQRHKDHDRTEVPRRATPRWLLDEGQN